MNALNILEPSPPRSIDDEVSVLRFWCCFAADEFTVERRARVAAFVTRAAIDDPRWPQAAAGDAAAAIGMALSRYKRFPDLAFDVAATAVLFCALRGDPAARVVLGAMVRNHRIRDRVASSWSAAPSVDVQGEV